MKIFTIIGILVSTISFASEKTLVCEGAPRLSNGRTFQQKAKIKIVDGTMMKYSSDIVRDDGAVAAAQHEKVALKYNSSASNRNASNVVFTSRNYQIVVPKNLLTITSEIRQNISVNKIIRTLPEGCEDNNCAVSKKVRVVLSCTNSYMSDDVLY